MMPSQLFQGRIWRWGIFALLTLIALLLVFQLGVVVGYRKARFSYRWGEEYHRFFGGPPQFLRSFRGDRDLLSSHGTSGTVVRRDGQTIVIRGVDDEERVILVNDRTVIRARRTTLTVNDIHVDDQVVILGEPNDVGVIIARFIRLFR